MATVGRGTAVAQIGRLHLHGTVGWLAWLGLHIVRTGGLKARTTVTLDWISGYLFTDRSVRLITSPDSGHPAPPQPPAAPGGPAAPPRADLPSVSVSNANRWGRAAALSWWAQAYPGKRKEPPKLRGRPARRARMRRLRHELTGDKSQTTVDYGG